MTAQEQAIARLRDMAAPYAQELEPVFYALGLRWAAGERTEAPSASSIAMRIHDQISHLVADQKARTAKAHTTPFQGGLRVWLSEGADGRWDAGIKFEHEVIAYGIDADGLDEDARAEALLRKGAT